MSGDPRDNVTAGLPDGWFRELWVGHDRRDPPEATLVLGAAAAMNGFRFDGEPMSNAYRVLPTRRQIAKQLGLHQGAVKRGAQHLESIGVIQVDRAGGIHVDPTALRARAASLLQIIRLTTRTRRLRMRPAPLLLTGLVEHQLDRRRGHLRLGVARIAERLGWTERVVERALAAARKAEAIRTWSIALPGGGYRRQLYLAPWSQTGGCSNAQTGGCRTAPDPKTAERAGNKAVTDASRGAAPTECGGRHGRKTVVVARSQSGGGVPDGSRRDSPEQKPASPAGETRASSSTPGGPTAGNIAAKRLVAPRAQAVIEEWVLSFVKKGIEVLTSKYAPDLAGLLDTLAPEPAVVHHRAAFLAQRRAFAVRVIAWCSSVERLGRWLVRVSRWYGVVNLPAYLRRACQSGDPGTVLESEARKRIGRGAERLRDFSRETETALDGPFATEVAQMAAAVGDIARSVDDTERAALRDQLRGFVEQKRSAAARVVLLRLLGDDRSDVAVARATEGILTLQQAKCLLEVA